jgi:16S rRNA (cytosine1402-N4)-methyltransferase
MNAFSLTHKPVLLDQVIDLLDIDENDYVVDGTLGLGGHAKAILTKLGANGRLYGFDLDSRNMQEARKRLKNFEGKVYYVNDNFCTIDHYQKVLKIEGIDKVVLDLGLSSPHVDVAEYGFSFKKRGPLDMRFSRKQKLTASMVVNGMSEAKIAEILFKFGELKSARKVAAFIVEERQKKPFVYTDELAMRLEPVLHPPVAHKELACIFQALRIVVNDELNVLYSGLNHMFELLKPGGRIAVISYHSLEDRIVKNFIKKLEKPLETDPVKAQMSIHAPSQVEVITKKIVVPTDEEIEVNPRARSAKLRVFKKI